MSERNSPQGESTKEQTGETMSIWTVRQVLPGAYRKPVRHYMTDNDMTVGEVLTEALEVWAKVKGIDLPPRDPILAWAS